MADLRGQQIKDRFQSLLTTSETTADPTTGTLQNGNGANITSLTLGGTLSVTGNVVTSIYNAGSSVVPDANNWNLPAGRFSLLGSTSGAGQSSTRWIGLSGLYNDSGGSAGLLLQAGHRDTNEPAGSFIRSLRTGTATQESLIFGHLTGGSTTSTRATLTERMRINSAGNVGIGTSSPARILDVNGDAAIHGVRVGRGAGNISTNTALGSGALNANTTGNNTTAIGFNALLSNTIGIFNTATGFNALQFNTTGSDNTATGRNALGGNTTGNNNTATGFNALVSNTIGVNNTATGRIALNENTTGNNNTATGVGAGAGVSPFTNANTTGNNNTFIGFEAVGASATASNVITLGNSSIATLRCQVTTITSLSDERDKKDIAPLNAGLDFLTKLRPVSFKWNTRDGAKVDIDDAGFIAQELLAVQADTGITIPNLVSQENPDKLEAGYGTLIPVLVSAVQELTSMVKQLQNEIDTLKGSN
jgi:hypothetical protein